MYVFGALSSVSDKSNANYQRVGILCSSLMEDNKDDAECNLLPEADQDYGESI